MNIQQLKYLAAVAETRSISQAAEQMFVSQSSISKALKSLEQEVGFRILLRGRSGVTFTADGQRFLQDVYPLLDNAQRIRNTYLSDGRRKTHFAVSSQHYRFAFQAFVTLVQENRHEEYVMELLERRTQTILTDVLSRRSDLGILYLTASNKAQMLDLLAKDGLAFQPFCTARPHVFLSRNHPLAGQETLTLDQLRGYPHVQYSYEEDRPLFAEEYAAIHENPREIVTTDRHSLINIIKETDAYTTGSGYMAGEAADDVAVIPLKGGEKTPMLIGWTYLPEPGLSDLARRFIDLCRIVLRKRDNIWLTLREDAEAVSEL